MANQISIKKLQDFIKSKDYNPDLKQGYFFKLIEEVGELSEAIRKDIRLQGNDIKGTVEEELYDVLTTRFNTFAYIASCNIALIR
jgi:NTP pyrophosphatase (non-canonical NTP hydrolase)